MNKLCGKLVVVQREWVGQRTDEAARQYTVNTSVQAGLSRFMSGTTAQVVTMFYIKRSKTNHKSSSRRPQHKS